LESRSDQPKRPVGASVGIRHPALMRQAHTGRYDMANANFYLDEMDSCPTHGIDAMRHTPVDGETPRNLDHWDCAECDFNAGSIDWVARGQDVAYDEDGVPTEVG